MIVEPLLPSTPLEQLLYATVRLTARDDAKQEWFGTGIVFQIPTADGQNAPFLISNRHVLQGATYLRAVFHRRKIDSEEPSGSLNGCDIDLDPSAIVFHPDPNIDLAAVPLASILEHWHTKKKAIYFKAVSTDLVPNRSQWRQFDALEDIVMIGCPNGLYDSSNNFAIFRRGTTASALSVHYEHRPEFLVDIACFGGSSGSPIFVFNPYGGFDRGSNKYTLGAGKFKFAGVLYAGPLYAHEGKVIMRTPIVNITTTMHLGFAIRSTEVVRMLKDFLLSKGVALQSQLEF